MVSVCTVPARGGRSCERFGGYKTINRIPLPLPLLRSCMCLQTTGVVILREIIHLSRRGLQCVLNITSPLPLLLTAYEYSR